MYLVWFYWWILLLIFNRYAEAEDNVCKDIFSKRYCTVEICKKPGVADHCKKTCGKCTDVGECKDGQIKQSDGTCSCSRGKWGPSCNETCSKGCSNDRCQEPSGVCISGCKNCYTGSKCDVVSLNCKCDRNSSCDCKTGYYGDGCSEICNPGCAERLCTFEGVCAHGCIARWFGQKCDKQCQNCVNDSCDMENGTCKIGCKDGIYGSKCNSLCSANCKDITCNITNGGCSEGCLQGWFGNRCDSKCSVKCVGNTCDRNGRCDQGCQSGWYSDKCDIRCPVNCETQSCDRSDGSCSYCKKGYTGHHCNMSCPGNCSESRCNQHNGSCGGCKDGYSGSHCDTTCPNHCSVCEQYGERCTLCNPGWYGQLCEKSCQNCVAGICNITDGYCVGGCKVGFYNNFCSIPCSDHCFEKLCHTTNNDHTDPACTEGCKDRWWGDYCDNKCPPYCPRCGRYDGGCPECEGTKYGANCKKDVGERNVVILWVVVPCFLILVLLVLAFFVLKRNTTKKPFRMKRRILSPKGIGLNVLSMINPSYMSTPRGSSTPEEGETSEFKPLTKGDKVMGVQLRADLKKDENPFYRPPRMHPRVFSTYIPSGLIQDDLGRCDSPFPCQLPDEPQLGCVWSTEVPVENFRDYVKTLNRSLGLTNQFYDLPYGRLGPCDEGERQVNAFKNRYRNILPYDHSRVTLQYIDGIPGSDYINANFINGYGKPKAFVATQGPYADVLWDFWRMVWEIDTGKIVMLTNFVENRKIKCDQYWPDLGRPRINYDGVFVQCVTEKKYSDYTVRTFTVSMEEEPPRTVKQYHFTTWPDKGVPQDVTSLVDFHQVVKQSPASRHGPIIVHCSAGVGRTGTFLALDYLIAQARAEGVVDAYECVTRIRHQRMDAIQTEEQYVFLHDALVEALPSGDTPSMGDTGRHGATKKQNLNGQSKRRPESPRNLFIDQNPSLDDKRYQTSRLPDIPLETFSSLLSTTPDRRS